MSLTIDNSSKLSGLASGLETDTIVVGLMSVYQTKLDKQARKTTRLEWTADAYREINTLIKNFRSQYLSVLSEKNMLSGSSYGDMRISMLSATSAVSVTASSSAVSGTMTIDSITQLAAAAKASSTGVFTGTSYSSDTTLSALSLSHAFSFDGNGELSFSINGEPFTFTESTTIAEMMKAVNSSDAGVTMRYSSLTKGFSITSDATGSASGINIVNIAGNAFSTTNSALGIAQGTYTGQDAICSINGISVTQPGNSFSYDGVSYTLNAASASPIQFSISEDYQSTVESIVNFVDAYNELVEALQSKVKEKTYYDYDALTDAQKEGMTEEQIEKWEEKAKSGVLGNDLYISSLLTTLRSAFYTEVEGTGMNLADIGLTTGVYSNGAKITVDKDKLLAALKENPGNVKSLFVQTSISDSFSGEGVMVRISGSMLNYTKQTTDIALDSLESKIAASEDKEGELEERMKEKEETLWARFSAMEAALSRLNSMSGWLSTLFSSSS